MIKYPRKKYVIINVINVISSFVQGRNTQMYPNALSMYLMKMGKWKIPKNFVKGSFNHRSIEFIFEQVRVRLLFIQLLYNYKLPLGYRVARVTQLLERWRKNILILALRVQIPLWDVGGGLSDEAV
jgi:hypothetical protein